ncbi:carboxypeptidase-like regulatory domain-containing protein [uncultured Tenacibaculum sp.]|uniref:carboxypeptidase-like regulatory domain-containing protein n=1 Tax=uncultured Tenacibaculum sp. TaxID=174713 RepID=UPI0026290B85|nr:carboxypeptidase-like regulatory domain-containing protein [uncultured Tenacibaculum sp.]
MKKGFILYCLFTFISIYSFSQTKISGKIISNENENIEGASVYLNNTTIGTITNSNGEFQLKAPKGNYTLVISFLGYKVEQIPITTSKIPISLNITLKQEDTLLNEVIVHKTKYDDEWKYNLIRFKETFLGRTSLAEQCVIQNPKTLHFEYNRKTNSLTAFAKEPLKIKHKGLGYLITYDLVHFEIKGKQLFFSGYARYENLKKSIKKKWKQNRLKAYNGSRMHFLRSLLAQNLKNEGFLINQFKRVLNPERPSEEKIKMAREFIRLHNKNINFSKRITTPKTPLDSALVTLRKSRLTKYKDYLYKRDVPYKDMIEYIENNPFLNFENYLSITYTKESEEDKYLIGMFGRRKKASGVQTSNIVLLEKKSQIENYGILLNPHSIFNEGYWAFESFANMLPLNYQPQKKQ